MTRSSERTPESSAPVLPDGEQYPKKSMMLAGRPRLLIRSITGIGFRLNCPNRSNSLEARQQSSGVPPSRPGSNPPIKPIATANAIVEAAMEGVRLESECQL